MTAIDDFWTWGAESRISMGLSYPSRNALDGNLTLAETRRHRRRGGTPAGGKESKGGKPPMPEPSAAFWRVDRYLSRTRMAHPLEYRVLTLYHHDGLTLDRVAKRMRKSRTTVRRIREDGYARYEKYWA